MQHRWLRRACVGLMVGPLVANLWAGEPVREGRGPRNGAIDRPVAKPPITFEISAGSDAAVRSSGAKKDLSGLSKYLWKWKSKATVPAVEEAKIRQVPEEVMSALASKLAENAPSVAPSDDQDFMDLKQIMNGLDGARNSACKEAAESLRKLLLAEAKQAHPRIALWIVTNVDSSEKGLDAGENIVRMSDDPEVRKDYRDILKARVDHALVSNSSNVGLPDGLLSDYRPGGKVKDPIPYAERYLRIGGQLHDLESYISIGTDNYVVVSPVSFCSWLAGESARRSVAQPEQYAVQWLKDHKVTESLTATDWMNAGMLSEDEKNYPHALACLSAALGLGADFKVGPSVSLDEFGGPMAGKMSKKDKGRAMYHLSIALQNTGRPEEALRLLRALATDAGWADEAMRNTVREAIRGLEGGKAK